MSQKKEQLPPLNKAQLEAALQKIDTYNKDIFELEEELKQYYLFLKSRGVDVKVLKQVAKIWNSDDADVFADYWEIFQQKEQQELVDLEMDEEAKDDF